MERARQAIELWWYVYRYLLTWAQSQITGFEWAKTHPNEALEIADSLAFLTCLEDLHLMEYLGMMFVYNVVDQTDPFYKQVSTHFERLKTHWTLSD